MLDLTSPGPTVRQVSGMRADSSYVLSVLTKRTYTIDPNGQCALAAEQIPLVEDPIDDPDQPGLLLHDWDLFPFKHACDVVVKGHAYGNGYHRWLEAIVQVGAFNKRLLVVGDRRCYLAASGQIVISTPEPIERVPLRYNYAYGGRDAVTESRLGNPLEQFRDLLPEIIDVAEASPYVYPRNRAGTGYLIEATNDAVEQLRLPNLEDPADPLTAERLVVGDPRAWLRMPLPQSTDWVDISWFPRVAYSGLLPDFADPDATIAEIARGFAPPDVLVEKSLPEKFDERIFNGASLGLQISSLRGGEDVMLHNMHATASQFWFRLPMEQPLIWTDGRKGRLNSTEPVIQTVVIEPDQARLTILWRGTAHALRPYLPDELATMPFRVIWR